MSQYFITGKIIIIIIIIIITIMFYKPTLCELNYNIHLLLVNPLQQWIPQNAEVFKDNMLSYVTANFLGPYVVTTMKLQ
jgi:hypothetical protein